MRKLKFLLLAVLFGSAFNTLACDEAYITFNSETDNGDGTFTYNLDLCVEFNGLEGNPDWFSLEFSGTSYTSIDSYSPSVISSSSGDDYNGAIIGDELRWTTLSIITAHCCQNLCTNVTVTTNGQVESIIVTYSDEYVSYPTCQETINFPVPCDIVGVAAGAQTACDPGTNTYTQDVVVTYSAAPSSGDLDVNGQLFAITSSPQTVTLTGLVADGLGVGVTASFTDDPFCSFTDNLLFVAPADCTPCSISDITATTQTLCDPGTNTYEQVVTITYTAAPGTGTIDVNGQSFPITSSPQSVNLVGLTADGNSVDVTAVFSDDPSCTFTSNGAFTAPTSCSTPCTPDNGTWD
jgi:hypothetical protein